MSRLVSCPRLLVICGVAFLATGPLASVLHAQNASSPSASSPAASSPGIDAPTPQAAPAIAPQTPDAPLDNSVASAPTAAPADRHRQFRQLAGTGKQRQTPEISEVHFSLWDRTPFDAFLPGGSALSGQQVSPGAGANMQNSPFSSASADCSSCGVGARAMTSNAMGSRGAGLGSTGQQGQMGQMNFNQFMRAAIGMNLSSSLGSFRMSYTDGLNSNVNALGKSSAQAMFNSPTYDGRFNFSAAEMMGSGGMHGAFSSGAMGSNSFGNAGSFGNAPMGALSDKRSTTSVTMRMSF